MKKYIFPALIFFASCNGGSEEKKVEVKPEDIQVVEQVDNNPQPFFAGSGSAPTSTIEIISNADGTFLVKYVVEGVAAELSMNKEPLVIDGKQNVSTGEVKLKNSAASIVLAPGKCEGGTHSCTLTLGDRVVEYCGKYAE